MSLEDLSKEELFSRIKELEEKLKRKTKYGLVWESKDEDVILECENKYPILKNIKERSIRNDPNGPVNVLIEGDNYHALQILNYTHKGKVDVIYIDPPYNIGIKNPQGETDFIYNDKFIDKEDSFKHSKWISFIHRRLLLAKELLSENGVIFISINDIEYQNLKLICDQVFGEDNFVTNFIWEKTQHFGRQKVNYYSNSDYILCFTKKLRTIEGGKREVLVEYIKGEFEDAPLYNAGNKLNSLIFPIGSVKFNIADGLYNKTENKKYLLENEVCVKGGVNTNPLKLAFKSRWSQDTVNNEVAKGTVFLVKSKDFSIRALYPDGKKSLESPKQIIFTNSNSSLCTYSRFGKKVGTNEDGSRDLFEILDDDYGFDYPKPKSLIGYLLSLIYSTEKGKHLNDITVLDFFAGSGTTGHAVLELNKEDGGNRKFILVTNNGDEKSEHKIAEKITYERLKRVMNGYKNKKGEQVEGLGGNLEYLQCDFIEKVQHQDNMRFNLAQNSTDLISLKEEVFDIRITNPSYKIMSSINHSTAISFDLDDTYLDKMHKDLEKFAGTKSAYIFSFTNPKETIEKLKDWKNIQIEEMPSIN